MLDRRIALVIVPVVAALALAACSNDSGSSGKASASSGGGSSSATRPADVTGRFTVHGSKTLSGSSPTVEIEANDYYFSPTFVKTEAGATVTVQLKNDGSMPHTFTIDGGPDVTLAPDKTATETVTVPSSGSVVFFCRFHQASGMRGAFTTGTAGSATASTTTTASSSGY